MSELADDTRAIVAHSRQIADNADYLSIALLSGDSAQIEGAIDDLVASYDAYKGQAQTYAGRLGFDDVAKIPSADARDQTAATALASALVDLEVAGLLAQAAQAAGEIEGPVSAAELEESVTELNDTLRAIGDGADPEGASRFSFDEVVLAAGAETAASPDIPSAKIAYEKQMKLIYENLFNETIAVLMEAFKQVADLDADKVKEGLNLVRGRIEPVSGGQLVSRVVDAVQRAIDTLKGLVGDQVLERIEERLKGALDAIREGGGALPVFIHFSYQSEAGQKQIGDWLRDSTSDQARIDHGTAELRKLQEQIVQTFTLTKRVIGGLRSLSTPAEWILKRFGGSLPLDLLLLGAYLLVIDVSLLRGMDYSDTTKLVALVDGAIVISRKTLGATEHSPEV